MEEEMLLKIGFEAKTNSSLNHGKWSLERGQFFLMEKQLFSIFVLSLTTSWRSHPVLNNFEAHSTDFSVF